MKVETTRKIISAVAILLGIVWFGYAVLPFLLTALSGEKEAINSLLYLPIIFMMAIPGLFLLIPGIKLWRSFHEPSLKYLVGTSIVLALFYASYGISLIMPKPFNDDAIFHLGILVSIPIYVLVVRLPFYYFTKNQHSYIAVLSKSTLAIAAWVLWLSLSSIQREIDKFNVQLGLACFIVPYILYRIAAHYLNKAKQKEKEEIAAPL